MHAYLFFASPQDKEKAELVAQKDREREEALASKEKDLERYIYLSIYMSMYIYMCVYISSNTIDSLLSYISYIALPPLLLLHINI